MVIGKKRRWQVLEMENYRFEEGEIKEEEIIKVVSNKNFDISSLLSQPTKIIQTKDSIFRRNKIR